jgi:hypothetical protein
MAQRILITAISLLFMPNAFTAPLAGHPTIHGRDSDLTCAPGGNSNLASFNLQLPTDKSGKIDQISSTKLSGYGDWDSLDYFYTSLRVHWL